MVKKPDFKAITRVGEKQWSKIGSGWINPKGNLSVYLSVLPTSNNGRYNFLLVPNGKSTNSQRA
jgi:hypothetical protein